MIEAPVFHVNGDRPLEVALRGATRARVPPEVQRAMSSSTSSATAATATTRPTSPASPSRTWRAASPSTPATGHALPPAARSASGVITAERGRRHPEGDSNQPGAGLSDELPSAEKTQRPQSFRGQHRPAPAALLARPGRRPASRREKLRSLGTEAASSRPPDFKLHPTIAKRFLAARREGRRDGGAGIDWAYAEVARLRLAADRRHRRPPQRPGLPPRHLLASATAVLYDNETRERYIPLQNLAPDQAPLLRLQLAALAKPPCSASTTATRLLAPNMLILLGGAVRRLRQRRPGHHRPVHRQRREQVAAAQRHRAAPAARLRRPGPRALAARASSASSSSAPRSNMQVANLTTPAQYFHVAAPPDEAPASASRWCS